MSRNLPIKTSSRAGRFKKKLVSAEELLHEAPYVRAKIVGILEHYNHGSLTAAELAGLYIISYLSQRYPGDWLGAKAPVLKVVSELNFNWRQAGIKFEPNIEKRLKEFSTLGDIFQYFALKSTPLAVNRALLSWSNGSYSLELMFRIPKPSEVLDQQKRGHRCVTILTEEKQMQSYVLGERDALGFAMHDLIHADHFYHHPEVFEGQLGFYGLLDHCTREQHFEELLKNEKFAAEFEYLISDMNAYAVHLMKCFKSAITHFHEQSEDFFEEWLVKVNPKQEELKALLELNGFSYDPVLQDAHILAFLSKWRHGL